MFYSKVVQFALTGIEATKILSSLPQGAIRKFVLDWKAPEVMSHMPADAIRKVATDGMAPN